jgi:hypothetical protein
MARLTPAEFNKLPRSEKAVLVAKDVIKQIKAEHYFATPGDYISLTYDKEKIRESASAQECLINNKLECEVCIRGAIFVSAVRFKNKLTVEQVEYAGFNDVHGRRTNANTFTKDIFSKSQQELMEEFFEANEYSSQECNTKDTIAVRAYAMDVAENRVLDADVRMVEAMKNVIRNDGKFIIPKKYYASNK